MPVRQPPGAVPGSSKGYVGAISTHRMPQQATGEGKSPLDGQSHREARRLSCWRLLSTAGRLGLLPFVVCKDRLLGRTSAQSPFHPSRALLSTARAPSVNSGAPPTSTFISALPSSLLFFKEHRAAAALECTGMSAAGRLGSVSVQPRLRISPSPPPAPAGRPRPWWAKPVEHRDSSHPYPVAFPCGWRVASRLCPSGRRGHGAERVARVAASLGPRKGRLPVLDIRPHRNSREDQGPQGGAPLAWAPAWPCGAEPSPAHGRQAA